MARRRHATRSTLVGIAIATPDLRRAVIAALAASGRFEAAAFAPADIQSGVWPRGRFAAIVATPRAFRIRQRAGVRSRTPVILVVRAPDLVREKALLDQADAFILAGRLELLASAVILCGEGLSVFPKGAGVPSPQRPARRPIATKKK